ncbi:aromatic-ring-hydroxylating dioxygenase subunit beta [Nocardia amamiensis]|uniref:aromatic-ring-hydroxylating dioxygenase subunit beta n=1 Tax=Nocardia amamiensis TaxID=404578 RepID=UPI00083259D6|nr:aromatic-ring-hydroxylating dioxygenase subunit beta [Nocardia amamiensis]
MTMTLDQASSFLFREARILDQRRYSDWLELWATEAEYWIPVNDENSDPKTHLALAYLDRKALEGRVMRLNSGQAHAQDPASQMNRIVGNIEIEPRPDGGKVDVYANFNLTELRRHEQHTFAGRYEYTISVDGADWLIERKKVTLVNLDEPIANLSFFL